MSAETRRYTSYSSTFTIALEDARITVDEYKAEGFTIERLTIEPTRTYPKKGKPKLCWVMSVEARRP